MSVFFAGKEQLIITTLPAIWYLSSSDLRYDCTSDLFIQVSKTTKHKVASHMGKPEMKILVQYNML